LQWVGRECGERGVDSFKTLETPLNEKSVEWAPPERKVAPIRSDIYSVRKVRKTE
jgi:hypothetical protein